jgi:gas vesicle protein
MPHPPNPNSKKTVRTKKKVVPPVVKNQRPQQLKDMEERRDELAKGIKERTQELQDEKTRHPTNTGSHTKIKEGLRELKKQLNKVKDEIKALQEEADK